MLLYQYHQFILKVNRQGENQPTVKKTVKKNFFLSIFFFEFQINRIGKKISYKISKILF